MDIERTMQFIVEQQAQLTASVQEHREQLARNDAQIAKNSETIGVLTDLVGRLAQAEIRLVERMDGMESRPQDVEGSQQEMRVVMTRLFERMDRFIQGLEGNGHNPR